MRIKSFFSHTVEGALASGRQELGAEAMLVNTRRAPADTGHEGEYEVVLATDAPEPPDSLSAGGGVLAAAPREDRLSIEVSDLKKELEGMRRTLAHSAFAAPAWGREGSAQAPSGDAAAAYAVLTGNEVDSELAREIVES